MSILKKAVRNTLKHVLPATGIRGRHAIADLLWRWAIPDPPVERISINGIKIEIDHQFTTCRHMYYGIYEEPFVKFMERTRQPGDVFFDLRANIGFITAIARGSVKVTGRVISYEPSHLQRSVHAQRSDHAEEIADRTTC